MSAVIWICVALLGGLGAIARFVIDGRVAGVTGRSFPYGTLVVNLSGAFVFGILLGAEVEGDALVLAGAATLGSYTTFSTWMYETHRLVEDGRLAAASRNVAVSLALGIAAAILGRTLGSAL